MGEFEKHFYREQRTQMAKMAVARELGEAIFTEWRDTYMAKLLNYIRTYRICQERGLTVHRKPPTPEWCNAAIHILSVSDVEIQDYFLRADPDLKDKLVQAVIDDDGINRNDGYFAPLPLL